LNTFYRPLLNLLLTVLFVLAIAPDLHAEKRVGVIMTGNVPYYNEIHQALAGELNRRFAGKEKIEILLQRPFPNAISWSNAARKLIAFDVDLIVTYGSPATLAVIHEKSRIPLVFAGFYEPEKVAANIKNVSGCGFKVPLSSILRYFKRLKQVNTLGIIFSSVEEDSVRQYETMLRLTDQQGIRAEKYDIRTKDDLDKLKTKTPDVVFITSSSLVHLWLEEIVTILEKNEVPVADILPDTTNTGVLMTLYQPAQAQGEMAAEIAWQILIGAKPAAPAITTLRDTELVFNLEEARRLGITFPIQLLIEATKVIE
jgi:putative ABC transport system substrate-binding protein